MAEIMGYDARVVDFEEQITSIRSKLRFAIAIDMLAIGVSLAANIAEAPKTWPGILVAGTAPGFLAVAVWAWHLSHDVLKGWQKAAFTIVLGLIATACGVVSFSHIVAVAVAQGQTELAAIAIALIIDATAVLTALLIMACVIKLAELTKALATYTAEKIQKTETDNQQTERAELETERLQLETERAEFDRLQAEVEQPAELATSKAHKPLEAPVDDFSDTSTLDLVEDLTGPLNGSDGEGGSGRQVTTAAPLLPSKAGTVLASVGSQSESEKPSGSTTRQIILDLAVEQPRKTNKEIAAEAGVGERTVRRYLQNALEETATGSPHLRSAELAEKVGTTEEQAVKVLAKLGERVPG